ncbi:MAG: pyridoxamine 5'-phosphate oxidase family protein [Arenicellales bacterium]|jgi:hypothetical protein|nr:pyridoxamine 5'-phosphate oxidase family protein [Arenicellales bacterium]MDP6672377.1 pyridoxamine 5'-phosphate oxidase family protein [Arenicellales bacterium]MDP6725276.1 pyridoxamine 5'-phosphate oxidase family protein [Arenicellales bacterium]MDP7155168.1 pyridoxamine 5'-phosphate oxidase family protein [Arenicellales bacterium]MDP7481433.1 pyridoxamine 5'-phosphate oxidase family protein [Arenicellales bacterium]|tara:strand:- start:967 stop:1626 length:660 start_codon:yes stop_codon:yes gene_type:complete
MSREMPEQLEQTKRTRIKRVPKRGSYQRSTLYQIIDEALVCHVGFVISGEPHIIPTAIARMGDHVIIHGSRVSRMIKHLQSGERACITVTHLDGMVLARSAMHHSMNYRSVVIYGVGETVEGEQKVEALDHLTEHLVPGRTSDNLRPYKRKELEATTVLKFLLDEASAKIRDEPPVDDAEDYQQEIWAGVVPLVLTPGVPQPDPKRVCDQPLPDYLMTR